MRVLPHLRHAAPPRLCDPPCPERQAGIGPISPKPQLSDDWRNLFRGLGRHKIPPRSCVQTWLAPFHDDEMIAKLQTVIFTLP